MVAYDLAVIGGGPGGYVAAIRAAQLGLNVALFERERIGGLCLNWGCIPTKALLANAEAVATVQEAASWGISVSGAEYDYGAAVDRSREVVDQLVGGVERLLQENGITVIQGTASFVDAHTLRAGEEEYEAGAVIIATGASSRELPGVKPGGPVLTSREALELRHPPRRAVIVGAGPVGVEFAHLWATYGSEVTLVEMLERVLPLEDRDVGRAVKRSFEARGIACLTGTRVEGVEVSGDVATVTLAGGDGEERRLEAEAVLIAVGFTPRTGGLELERVGIATESGFVTIDDHMETNVRGIYAIGDVTGKLMLAHVASQQGVVAAEHIAGREPPVLDYVQMPRATFCEPQVGSVGYTEEAAREAGFTVRTGRFPFSALAKAITVGRTEGFTKVVADEETGQILGVHVVGHGVNELLGEISLASLLEATTVELGFAVHAHPTLSEALKEAALGVTREAIHMARRRAPGAAAGSR